MYPVIISKPHFMSKIETGFLVDLVEKSKGLSKVLALVGMVSTAANAQAENPQWESTNCPDALATDGQSCVAVDVETNSALKRVIARDEFMIGGVKVPLEYLSDSDVQAAAAKYKAHLEAIDRQVNQEQSCDDTDDDFDTLWDDCNALHVAILNARVAAKQGLLEDSQAEDTLLAQKESDLTQHTLLQADQNKQKRETIAEQQKVLDAWVAYQNQ